MTRLRVLTAGESHGASLMAIVEGMPAGMPLDALVIDRQLARRQQGGGAGGRMKLERDRVQISGGVMAGLTTGGPIAMTVSNLDHARWADREIKPMTIPRPGHADLTALVKYGYDDLRLSLERASARETAMRVCVGAVCRQLLAHCGVQIGGYVVRIGQAFWDGPLPPDDESWRRRFAAAEESLVRCPDAQAALAMERELAEAKARRDTRGGVIEVAALSLPVGLGSHVHADRKLDAQLAAALVGLPSVKGVEFGAGFAAAARPGTTCQDAIALDGRQIVRRSNHAGGVEGGISTGQPLAVRVAFKPISTTLCGQESVDLHKGESTRARYERSDFCAVPRAVPIAEAVVAQVLANALLDKLGGDSLAEIQPRLHALSRAHLDDVALHGRPWRFDGGVQVPSG